MRKKIKIEVKEEDERVNYSLSSKRPPSEKDIMKALEWIARDMEKRPKCPHGYSLIVPGEYQEIIKKSIKKYPCHPTLYDKIWYPLWFAGFAGSAGILYLGIEEPSAFPHALVISLILPIAWSWFLASDAEIVKERKRDEYELLKRLRIYKK